MRTFLLLAIAMLILGCSSQRAPEAAACSCGGNVSPVCGVDNVTYNSSCEASCANVTVSHGGSCVVCSDSDGGKDPMVKGTASAAGLSYTDSCVNFTAVTEYFCNGDLISKETAACPKGYECLDGACVEPQPAQPAACQDSDGGPDAYTRGTVSWNGTTYTDSCTPDKQLLEYDCAGTMMVQTTSPCPKGSRCDSGRCVRADVKCVESDAGKDIYTAGELNASVNLVSLEFLDKCLDNQTLREYYCVGDDYNSEDITCPPDYQCLNAACRPIVCTDTDGGINIYQAGAVNKGSLIFRDSCSSGSGGTEYYCDNNQVRNASFNCPGSYYCSGGRCIR